MEEQSMLSRTPEIQGVSYYILQPLPRVGGLPFGYLPNDYKFQFSSP